MPRLPNALIYLQASIRPTRLKPDLRIPSISWVDWNAARRDGWDAVVVDKDNCLKGWAELKAAFGPGNVLIVSNSAGTSKDGGGIAAESVSRALGVPVLLHAHPKPGCVPEIASYFSGQSPIHAVGRPPRVGELAEGWEVVEGVQIDEMGIMEEGDGRETLLGRRPTRTVVSPPPSRTPRLPIEPPTPYRKPLAHPRLLVIGDRLATDVLLARRLAAHYRHTSATPAVLSIVTTSLFKKSDARILRWMEESWLRLGLALSARLTRRPVTAEYESTMRNWVLPYSVDAPPATPTVVKPTAPTANLRVRIKSYVSGPAWRAWLFAQIPSRQRVLRAVKGGLGRGAAGVIGMVRRLLLRRARSA